MNKTATTARYPTMSLGELIRSGPREIVLLSWLAGLSLVLVWLAFPRFRIAMVVDPRLAAVLGASIAGMAAVRVLSLFFARTLRPEAVVIAGLVMLMGALAMALAATEVFGPLYEQASECAPRVLAGESAAGRAASVALPLVLWLCWCAFLITRLRPMEEDALAPQTPAGPPPAAGATPFNWRERYRASSRFLCRAFPVRLALSLFWALAVISAVERLQGDRPPGAAPSDLVRSDLVRSDRVRVLTESDPPSAWALAAGTKPFFARVEAERLSREQSALQEAASLRLDEARPLAEQAACGLLMPGHEPSPRMREIRQAFHDLDRDMDARASWSPSARSVESILSLLPLGAAAGPGAPVCPDFWRAEFSGDAPDCLTPSDLSRSTRTVSYRGRALCEILTAALVREDAAPAVIEVAINVGAPIGAGAFFSLVEKRLGVRPSVGPQPIGAGAPCAVFLVDGVGIRLGPAVGPKIPDGRMAPSSALWITCFEPRLSPALDRMYRRADGSAGWSPHGCGRVPPSRPCRPPAKPNRRSRR